MNIRLRKSLLCCVLGASILAGVVGCGQSGGASGEKAFDTAPPEVKQMWVNAVTAEQSGDHFTAVIGYQGVLGQADKLQPKQISAAEEASKALLQRLLDASAKGDEAARKVLDRLAALDRAKQAVR